MRPAQDRFDQLFHSIRFRLALWFVAILAIVILAFSAFVYTRQVYDLRNAAATRVEYKAQSLVKFLGYSGREYLRQIPLTLPRLPDDQEALIQERDVLAFIQNNRLLQSWGPLDADGVLQVVRAVLRDDLEEPVQSGKPFIAGIPVNGVTTSYAFLIAPITYERRVIGFYVLGSPVDPYNQLPRLLFSLGLGVLLTLAAALAGGVWLADRAMSPVKRITAAARSIGETDLSRRLRLGRKDELGELADTFDAMLSRLEAAFERQRQFTADASHELRTPLTIVDLEASRALAAPRRAQEYVRTLQVIHSENQFMSRLVNNLLTLARMDAGQVVLQLEPLDLSDVALEVIERLAPIARKEQVRLLAGELPEVNVLGDRQYLVQMLSNLVENGIKYAQGPDSWVEVTAGPGLENKVAWVRVADNGPGIPSERLPHLFDRFYQVDAARTRTGNDHDPETEQLRNGAGLGLSIAQWIARAHEGDIHVQSQPGQGSSFEVRLPLI